LNKITLKYELDLNFTLIAITCPLKDYRLCHYINRATRLNLIKNEDHEIWVSRNHSLFFPKYSYISSIEETEFYLIGNKGIEGGFLIPEAKATDYFMLIKGFIDDEDFSALMDAIVEVEEVLVAAEINVEKLKSKENLVF
jgi:hypothetical protein